MDHPWLLGWLQLAQTSSNQFLPVVACDLKGNSVAYRATSSLDFNRRGCVRQIWVDLSSLLILPTHALNYYIQKCFRYLGSRLIVFRTWIIRQCNPVWVHKLADIVTSLWLEIIKLDKEWFNVILLYGNILETNIWNKWDSESVNRLLTLINQQLLWKKKGTGLDSKWKISKSSVLHEWQRTLVIFAQQEWCHSLVSSPGHFSATATLWLDWSRPPTRLITSL